MDSFDAYYAGRKILVTGGVGFIGSNLARRLVALGADVLVVDSMQANTGANRANLRDVGDKLIIREVDLRSYEEIAELLPGREVVFNLAGRVSHIDSMTHPVSDLEANVHAQITFLEACRHYAPKARIVFASTRQVYGRPSVCPVDESHPTQPVDVNGIHKIAAESYHTLYHRVYGLQTVSLRLTNTFGPRMRIRDARQTFLGIWVRRVIENDALEVWGGEQKRDLTYVEDAVDAFLAAAASPATQGRIFNLGGCPPVTLAELAESLVAIAGSGSLRIKQYPADLLRIDIGDYFADDRLFRQLTGWAPGIALEEGLARTVSYFRNCLDDYV
jgi:UDP-glucose 4-epimerase